MTGSVGRRRLRTLSIAAAFWAGYAIIYPQLVFLDPHPGIIVVVPVVETGWLGGALGGCVASLASMPVTILMATVTGMGASVEVPPVIVYVVGSLLTVVGLTIGRVRDLNGQLGR